MNTIFTFISDHKAEIQQVNLGKSKAFVEIGVRQYPFILPDNKAREKLAAFAAQHKVKVFDTLAKAPASPKAAPKPAPRSQDSHMTTNNEPWPSQAPSRASGKPQQEAAHFFQVSEKPAMVLMPSAKNALARQYKAVFGTEPEEWEMRYLTWAVEYAKPLGGKLATVIARWAKSDTEPALKEEPKPVEPTTPAIAVSPLGIKSRKLPNKIDNAAWNQAVDTYTANHGGIAPTQEAQDEAMKYVAAKRRTLESPVAMELALSYAHAKSNPLHCHGEVGSN